MENNYDKELLEKMDILNDKLNNYVYKDPQYSKDTEALRKEVSQYFTYNMGNFSHDVLYSFMPSFINVDNALTVINDLNKVINKYTAGEPIPKPFADEYLKKLEEVKNDCNGYNLGNYYPNLFEKTLSIITTYETIIIANTQDNKQEHLDNKFKDIPDPKIDSFKVRL